MTRRVQCSGRNAKGTGPCQATASPGYDTCARCGGRRKPRAAKPMQLPPPEAMHGAEVTEPTRSACGDVHDEFTLCPTCDVRAPQPAGPEPTAADAVDATKLLDERGCEVWHATWQQLAERARELGGVDAVIVDAPYSERTHVGHDDGVDQSGTDVYRGQACVRKPLSYSAWSVEEVDAFVAAWAPLTRGWVASLTDHGLAPAWEEALEAAGRYAFAPIAVVDSGSRVRLVGDGPATWSVWLMVARPRSAPWNRWATIEARAKRGADPLPGAYVVPDGARDKRQGRVGERGVVGGKPLWLMRALVRDYTRPGDLVCDPCCGSGTTGLACLLEGRRFLGGDMMSEHAELAASRLRAMPGETKAGQLPLLGGA